MMESDGNGDYFAVTITNDDITFENKDYYTIGSGIKYAGKENAGTLGTTMKIYKDDLKSNVFYISAEKTCVDVVYTTNFADGTKYTKTVSKVGKNTTGNANESYDPDTGKLTLKLGNDEYYYGDAADSDDVFKYYTLSAITSNGYTLSKTGATTCEITVGSYKQVDVTVTWTGKPVVFKLKAADDSFVGSIVTIAAGASNEVSSTTKINGTLRYSDSVNMNTITMTDSWATSNAGYSFSKWKAGTTELDSGKAYTVKELINLAGGGSITDGVVDGGTITGVWAYRGYTIKSNAITGQYGENIEITVKPVYNDRTGYSNDSDTLGIKIPQQTITDLTTTYGLTCTTGTEIETDYFTYYKFTGQVTKMTTGDVTVTGVEVIDKNATVDGTNYKTTNNTITYNFSKRKVTIDPTTVHAKGKDTLPSKVYDGEKGGVEVEPRASVSTPATIKGIVDDIYATFDETAEFVDANAGTEKTLTVFNVQLATGSSVDLNNYVLVDADGNEISGSNLTVAKCGTISPKAINIYARVKGKDSTNCTVKYGQETPEYEIYLKDDAYSKGALETDADKALAETDINTLLGYNGISTTRTKYSPATEDGYSVTVQLNSTNYSESQSNVSALNGTITVERDEGSNYFEIVGEKNSKGYYTSISINPTGDYNQIRICGTEDDLLSDITSDEILAAADFKDALTVENGALYDMKDQVIYVQMRDSRTGAITTMAATTPISIDKTGPVLTKVSYTEGVNKLSFGGYYKPQDGNEFLEFTFTYTSEFSACTDFYYTFKDENNNYIVDKFSSTEIKATENADEYVAKVKLYNKGKYGKLIVWAEDEAGNSSAYNVINLKTSDFDSVSDYLNENAAYYEWMVDDSNPALSTVINQISVLTSSNVQAQAGGTYNGLSLSVTATDETGEHVSGMQKVVWTVTNTVTQEETTYESSPLAPGTGAAISSNEKATSAVFTAKFPDSFYKDTELSGTYEISAVLVDNAGNETELSSVGPYFIDTIAPDVTLSTPSQDRDEYQQSVTLTLTATEGKDESGINKVELLDADGKEVTPTETDGDDFKRTYTYEISASGKYTANVYDKAGNLTTESVTLSKISSVKPVDPTIDITGTYNKDTGWYIKETPVADVNTVNTKTSDGVAVTTTFTYAGKSKEFSGNSKTDLTDQGSVALTAVNVSESGMKSKMVSENIKIDTGKPVITITGSQMDTSGNVVVSFKVTDATSGVNAGSVTINDAKVTVNAENGSDAYTGSFVAKTGSSYVIDAYDVAGNEAESVAFSPLDLNVGPVTDITTTGANLSAKVIQGTDDIASATVEYKKHGASTYTSKPTVDNSTTSYGQLLDCTFKNLTADTVYDYKITARTANTNEVKTYTGSFKTATPDGTATLHGVVLYDNDLIDTYKTYPIYVTLTSSGATVAGAVIDAEHETGTYDYQFTNLANGSYQITATNGLLSKTAAVTIENNTVTTPSDYYSDDGVNLILSGFSTSVVIDDSDVALTADDMDLAFNDSIYTAITEDDYKVVAAGGNILITLHAKYLNVSSDLSDSEKSTIKSKLADNTEILRYIELYMTKTVTDVYGNKTVTNITELSNPITVSLPLGDLAGQKIYVASLHKNNDSSTSVLNWDTDSKVTLSNDYVTITTKKFSVYALYKYLTENITHTVTWLNGDKTVMKTETVADGANATPPTTTPTLASTATLDYVFSGWSASYNNITADTVIEAQFKAVSKNSSSTSNSPNSSTSTSSTLTTSVTKPTTAATTASDVSTVGTHYSYLGSSSSPKTGDEVPIVLICVLMTASAAGLVVFLKRRKQAVNK
jgi:hypothetical protein